MKKQIFGIGLNKTGTTSIEFDNSCIEIVLLDFNCFLYILYAVELLYKIRLFLIFF